MPTVPTTNQIDQLRFAAAMLERLLTNASEFCCIIERELDAVYSRILDLEHPSWPDEGGEETADVSDADDPADSCQP